MKRSHDQAVAAGSYREKLDGPRQPDGPSEIEFGRELEAGETPEAALDRELREELGVEICVPCLAPLSFASHAYDDFHLLMPLYSLRKWDGIARPREGQELAWVRPENLRDYPMPPADAPLVAALETIL